MKPFSSTKSNSFNSEEPPFTKVMAANRGEIAVRIMRAATELGCRTVGIYSAEDRNTAHPSKADEAYLVGEGKAPVSAYLDIDNIVATALENNCQAVHPGYGFLSENPEFNQKLEDVGITFVGPTPQNLIEFGDKTKARQLANEAKVPLVPGTEEAVRSVEEAKAFTNEYGFPIIIKAAHGGGGKGMRVVMTGEELEPMMNEAMGEALTSFGNGDVFLERYVLNPRHVEVQILGDGKGNVVHLYDRDCSVQRRHQKVLETAPAINLPKETRQAMFDDAVRLTSKAKYRNAGTVEFLVDEQGRHYFIEVNPRIQVEHTVTEEVTGINLVQSQFKIAAGATLSDLGLHSQDDVICQGHAMQCRITTEDASKGFIPDTGIIEVFRQPTGMGIRIDDGPGFVGAKITPFYDSLLVKLTGSGRDRTAVTKTLLRALTEFRIRGVTTNIPFLRGVLQHPQFLDGTATTSFIDENPHLLGRKVSYQGQNRAQRLMSFLGDTVVNGCPAELGANVGQFGEPPAELVPTIPKLNSNNNNTSSQPSLRQIYKTEGASAFAKAVRSKEKLLLTDTTWRDAHQSLLATRVRTRDITAIAPATAIALRDAYSIENWGGATFDVSLRFLRECPWDRLAQMRELVPDVPFQMLLRGANAVGYTSYPDNVVREFCNLAVKQGMDIFRIFDSLNYIENMRLGIDAVGSAGGIVEAAIGYTGDVLHDKPGYKYNLDYYLEQARQLNDIGIHVLCIKDMAGLLKPKAATLLVGSLRQEFPDLPIHVHTHDTAGTGVASMIACAEAGADAVDVATDAMSGLTSQPSMGAVVASLKGTTLDTGIDLNQISKINDYWEQARALYAPFESGQKSGSPDVYHHEIPGGQYTNLLFQSTQLGLREKWPEIKAKYADANEILGDIVKVTPSSKVVGDLAQYMTQNDLTKEDIFAQAEAGTLSLPGSVLEYFEGYLGIPHGGFPEPLRSQLLRGKPGFIGRPGAEMEPYNFDAASQMLKERDGAVPSETDVMSHIMYPDVYEDYVNFVKEYGDVSVLSTRAFVMGLEVGEEGEFELEKGKTLYVKLNAISEIDELGYRKCYFTMNGQARTIAVFDKTSNVTIAKREIATKDIGSLGASINGSVVGLKISEGDYVEIGDPLVILNAMKMEMVEAAPVSGFIKRVVVNVGDSINAGDLIVEIDEAK
jgi:pyruvate carboxylase